MCRVAVKISAIIEQRYQSDRHTAHVGAPQDEKYLEQIMAALFGLLTIALLVAAALVLIATQLTTLGPEETPQEWADAIHEETNAVVTASLLLATAGASCLFFQSAFKRGRALGATWAAGLVVSGLFLYSSTVLGTDYAHAGAAKAAYIQGYIAPLSPPLLLVAALWVFAVSWTPVPLDWEAWIGYAMALTTAAMAVLGAIGINMAAFSLIALLSWLLFWSILLLLPPKSREDQTKPAPIPEPVEFNDPEVA